LSESYGEWIARRARPWAAVWAVERLGRALRAIRKKPDPRHVLVALCDHFEPLWSGDPARPGSAPLERGVRRVHAWRRGYPELASRFRDANGRAPRHTFFYPGEQYRSELLEPVAELVERGFGEVEVHLHHADDTADVLAETLRETLTNYSSHGLVPTASGGPRFAFIHGNWCLANARRDGAHCGVDDELAVLHRLGCYADFTFPSAPDETQPVLVNSIYYPRGDVSRRRAHEQGRVVRVGSPPEERLLLITGPLAIGLRRGSGFPLCLDAAALTAKDPATPRRLGRWVDQSVHVKGRSEWVFLKLHTHGAPEREAESLLGAPQARFHAALGELSRQSGTRIHYVTAREMYNVARAAMDGCAGDPSAYFDYEVPPPPRASN